MIIDLSENFLTHSLHLSTIFVGSVTQLVITGILIKELMAKTSIKIRLLLIQMVIVSVLLEITLIFGFLANILDTLFFLHIPELIIAVVTLIFGITIAINFYDFLNKKLIFLIISFGIISIFGVITAVFFNNIIGGIIDLIGSMGVTVSLYFLVVYCVISCRSYGSKI